MATIFGVSLNPFSTPVGEKIGESVVIQSVLTILIVLNDFILKMIYLHRHTYIQFIRVVFGT